MKINAFTCMTLLCVASATFAPLAYGHSIAVARHATWVTHAFETLQLHEDRMNNGKCDPYWDAVHAQLDILNATEAQKAVETTLEWDEAKNAYVNAYEAGCDLNAQSPSAACNDVTAQYYQALKQLWTTKEHKTLEGTSEYKRLREHEEKLTQCLSEERE